MPNDVEVKLSAAKAKAVLHALGRYNPPENCPIKKEMQFTRYMFAQCANVKNTPPFSHVATSARLPTLVAGELTSNGLFWKC
jgi:hypothetical protein